MKQNNNLKTKHKSSKIKNKKLGPFASIILLLIIFGIIWVILYAIHKDECNTDCQSYCKKETGKLDYIKVHEYIIFSNCECNCIKNTWIYE